MTREEAIKLLVNATYSDEWQGNEDLTTAYNMAIKALEHCEERRWIPCSERLPEYRKLVLVTTRDLRVKPAYLDSIQDDGTDDWWSIPLDDADCALWNIVAWMPLPEPYKEGTE